MGGCNALRRAAAAARANVLAVRSRESAGPTPQGLHGTAALLFLSFPIALHSMYPCLLCFNFTWPVCFCMQHVINVIPDESYQPGKHNHGRAS